MNHRRHNRRARAADFAGFGANLDADDIARGDEAPPRIGDGWLAGQIREAAVDHVLDDGGFRLEIGDGVRIFDDDDARGRIGGSEENWFGGLNGQVEDASCQQKKGEAQPRRRNPDRHLNFNPLIPLIKMRITITAKPNLCVS
jgi:hypothetical protein